MNNKQDIATIRQFLAGELSFKEATIFAKRIKTDPILAEAVKKEAAFQKLVKTIKEDKVLAKEIADSIKPKKTISKRINDFLTTSLEVMRGLFSPLRQPARLVFSSVILVLGIVFTIDTPEEFKEGYSTSLYVPDNEIENHLRQQSETIMSSSLQLKFSEVIKLYSENDCKKALPLLAKIPNSLPSAIYTSGHCHFILGNYAKAVNKFEELEKEKWISYYNDIQWYLLLSYLSNGQEKEEKCISLLNELASSKNKELSQKATKIKKAINNPWKRIYKFRDNLLNQFNN